MMAHRTSAMDKHIKFTFRPRGGVWEFSDGLEPFGLPPLKGFPEIASLDGKGSSGSYYPLIYPSTMFCCTTGSIFISDPTPASSS